MWPTRGLGTPFLWASRGLGRGLAVELTATDTTVSDDAATLGIIPGQTTRTGGSPAVAGVRQRMLTPVPDTTVTDDTATIVRLGSLQATDTTHDRETATAATSVPLSALDETRSADGALAGVNTDAHAIRLLDRDLWEAMFPELAIAEDLTADGPVCV